MMNKTVNEQLRYVIYLMYKEPTISLTTFNKCYAILKRMQPLEEENSNEVEVLLAKLQYIMESYEKAIFQFKKALDKKETSSCYYGLYKAYVKLGRYKEAYDAYIKSCELNKYYTLNPESFNLVKVLLSYLIDYPCECAICYEEINARSLANKQLEDLYAELLDNIAIKNYSIACSKAQEMQEIINNGFKCHLEFDTLCILLEACYNKYYKEILKDSKKELIEAKNNEDYDTMYELVKARLYNNCLETELYEYLLLLIEKGYHKEVKALLPYINAKIIRRGCKKTLENMIREVEIIDKLDDSQREWYDGSVDIILELISERDYENAYDMANAAYYETEAPIFLYYMGYILFMCEHYIEAVKCFDEYVKIGEIKRLEALFFRVCSFNNINNSKRKKRALAKFSEYLKVSGRNSSLRLEDYSYYKTDYNVEYFYYKRVFESNEYQRIANLYQNGMRYEADEELKKLINKKDKTLEEKNIIKLLNTNKTLLLCKSKNQ